MAIVTKPPAPDRTRQPKKDSPDQNELRGNRIVAVITLIILAVIFALMIWLASLSGGSGVEDIDYWPMMP